MGFLLYSVNLLDIGLILGPIMASLMLTAWAFGFMTAGLFLRFGTNVQTLAWAGAFVLMPFSAVYYPLSTLPAWVQTISLTLPTTYVFEGMRSAILLGNFPASYWLWTFGLNFFYLGLSLWFFFRSFQVARENGIGHLK